MYYIHHTNNRVILRTQFYVLSELDVKNITYTWCIAKLYHNEKPTTDLAYN